jgi:outer membrane protein assembly factor BamB
VLTPRGVLLTAEGTTEFVKPVPAELDDWTHYLYKPHGNPVSKDTRVAPPAYAQWVVAPNWPQHHDGRGSAGPGLMVSEGGLLFTVFDDVPSFSMDTGHKPTLMAQDAFNGVVLWKKLIPDWTLYNNRGQPAVLQRRLVAHQGRLYFTLGRKAAVSVLDAATGNEIMQLPESEFTSEILVLDDRIVTSAGLDAESDTRRDGLLNMWAPSERWIRAYERESGKLLWKQKTGMFPLTMAATDEGIYYHDTDRVVCVNPADGSRRWEAGDLPYKKFGLIPYSQGKGRSADSGSFGPTLLVQDGVVLYSVTREQRSDGDMGHGILHAYEAKTGKEIWQADFPPAGECSPKDLWVVDGTVYMLSRETKGTAGLDLHTGEKKVEFPIQDEPAFFHPRCHRYKATEKYILPSNQGFEMIDLDQKKWHMFFWVRGSCSFGYLTANGMIYFPPGPCACFTDTFLHGTYALAPRAAWMDRLAAVSDEGRLETAESIQSTGFRVQEEEWATYRGDAVRRGYIKTPVDGTLTPAWKTTLGGTLTAPTIAAGKVFVAQKDLHALHALDADSGRKVWSYTTGGPIDSPPTILSSEERVSLCVFGSHDGYIYCLNAADGALVWRYRAAPLDMQMQARGHLASPWPVPGSVLFENGRIYAVAGRSIYLAGGMRLVQLDPATGKKLGETVLTETNPETGEAIHYDSRETVERHGMPVALPDILSSDGERIYMRSQPFDLTGKRLYFRNLFRNNDSRINRGALLPMLEKPERHVFSAAGFLDGDWFHRSYMAYANVQTYASGSFHLTRQFYPSGRVLVLDDEKLYTYARQPDKRSWIPGTVRDYRLMQTDLKPDLEDIKGKRARSSRWNSNQSFVSDWERDLPIYIRAMVKAGDRVFAAGPPDDRKAMGDELLAVWHGERGGSLFAVAATDGTVEQELKLDSPPVWDGMASAYGRVSMSLTNGEVVCFSGPGGDL